jgi:hypothetical protein
MLLSTVHGFRVCLQLLRGPVSGGVFLVFVFEWAGVKVGGQSSRSEFVTWALPILAFCVRSFCVRFVGKSGISISLAFVLVENRQFDTFFARHETDFVEVDLLLVKMIFDLPVAAIHPANKLVRNQIKELKGSAGTVYSWEGEILDDRPWLEPNTDYYKQASWGETGTLEEHGSPDNKANKLKTRAHWKHYKKPASHMSNKIFNFKRALERKNTICWEDDDEVKHLAVDDVQLFGENYTASCRKDDMKQLLQTNKNPLYTSAKGFATERKTKCMAQQQVRIAHTWRTRTMKKEVRVECFLMDHRKLPSPNTAGYRYNTAGKIVHAEKFNEQTLSFAHITLGNRDTANGCTDPYAEGRGNVGPSPGADFVQADLEWGGHCNSVTYTDLDEIGWDTQEQYEAKDSSPANSAYRAGNAATDADSGCDADQTLLTCPLDGDLSCCKRDDDSAESNKNLRVTFKQGSYAPHIAQFNVAVTPKQYKRSNNIEEECLMDSNGNFPDCADGFDKTEFFPNMLEVWVMCKVVDDNANPKRSPYRFINNDQPTFWEVPGINKFQFRFGFDFNKHLDSSQRESKSDETPNYPTPEHFKSGDAGNPNTYTLNNGDVYTNGKVTGVDNAINDAWVAKKTDQEAKLKSAVDKVSLKFEDFDMTRRSDTNDCAE